MRRSVLKHIIVVDDDSRMRNLLIDYLSRRALRVTGVKDSRQLAQVLSTERIHLIIVDLNLGHEDGLEIVRALSITTEVPIIIITGDRLNEADKVIGLELGASDYIVKPFGLREFLARIRAALRDKPAAPAREEKRIYSFAGWILDSENKKLVSSVVGEVKLTTGEFDLLLAFLRSPNQVLSREELLAGSRLNGEEIFDRSVDVQILRLRRKLEQDPANQALIKTQRGAGYSFDADVSVEDHARGRDRR